MSRSSYTPSGCSQFLGDGTTISDADYLLLNQTPFNYTARALGSDTTVNFLSEVRENW